MQVVDLPAPPRRLVTVAQMAEMVPAYSGKQSPIRWQLFNAETNGLQQSGAIVRNGRRVLLDVDAYFAWLVGEGSAP